MIAVSPRIANLLSQVGPTPDLEAALWKVLAEYVELKSAQLSQQIAEFESKWGMSFTDFSVRIKKGQLNRDAYSYDVEKDFWEWEKAETLLKHYADLIAQWG